MAYSTAKIVKFEHFMQVDEGELISNFESHKRMFTDMLNDYTGALLKDKDVDYDEVDSYINDLYRELTMLVMTARKQGSE